jgi:hypothetical protein
VRDIITSTSEARLCIKCIVVKSKGIKTGCSLAELSEVGCIQKKVSVLPTVMMVIAEDMKKCI